MTAVPAASLPPACRAQLEPLIERLLAKTPDPAPLILVRGEADVELTQLTVKDRSVDVLASSSPLEIRARAGRARSAPLAVVTTCDASQLGDDLVARAVGRRTQNIDRWQIVAQLFGAANVSSSLAKHNEIADALIQHRPAGGYRPVPTKVLDLDTALSALCRAALGLGAQTLTELLEWAERPEAARAMRELEPRVIDQLAGNLSDRLGPGPELAMAALRAGQGSQLTAIALAAEVIHDQDDQLIGSMARLDVFLGGPGLRTEVYQRLGAAAANRVKTTRVDQAPVVNWLLAADQRLAEWEAAPSAWRSDVLISGFEQRLARAAAAIDTWRSADAPHAPEAETAVVDAVAFARAHREAQETPHRVLRLEMAARMVRRLSAERPGPGTLGEAVGGYVSDGAWFDRARVVVSQGDSEPTTARLCRQLTELGDAVVAATGAGLARQLANAAYPLGDAPVMGVEKVLDAVVAPAAAVQPVLLLVFDGMGWPSFLDVLERLEQQGWHPQSTPPGEEGAGLAMAAMATLPTVTEFSRASLLCGELVKGDKDREQRYFAARPSLVNASAKAKPPRLFHKTELRLGGLDALPADVLDVVADADTRVVGVVLNNIDERLKDVPPPPGGWGLDELTPLRDLLVAARRAGRALVVTADHGHVLERGRENRSGGGGERWRRIDTGPVGEGEIAVQGPRVLTEDHAAVLPWAERIVYSGSRNGYHGGLTGAEAIVPVVVFATESPDQWEEATIAPPTWWWPTTISLSGLAADGAVEAVASPPKKRSRKPEPETVPLFEAVDEPVALPVAASVVAGAIERIMASDHVAGQLGALRLDSLVVTAVLQLLDNAGGTPMGEDRVAAQVGMPRSRMGRFITQLQRLLNIDGYEVVSSIEGEIRFDRALLETQLGLR